MDYEIYVARCQRVAVHLRDVMAAKVRVGVPVSVAEGEYNSELRELLAKEEERYLEAIWEAS